MRAADVFIALVIRVFIVFSFDFEQMRFAASQRFQERYEVVFVLPGQIQVEARVVKIDGIHERRCGTVVEIGRAAGKPSQDWTFEFADVGALAGDHGAADVGNLNLLAGGVADHGDEREVRRAAGSVGQADV